MSDSSPHFSLPRLYKKTSLGALQFWDIKVFSRELSTDKTIVGEIVTVYGQEGTDSPQVATDIISVGKNAGQANETSALEQAVKEAKASWLKKKKGGYVEGKEAAGAGEFRLSGRNPRRPCRKKSSIMFTTWRETVSRKPWRFLFPIELFC